MEQKRDANRAPHCLSSTATTSLHSFEGNPIQYYHGFILENGFSPYVQPNRAACIGALLKTGAVDHSLAQPNQQREKAQWAWLPTRLSLALAVRSSIASVPGGLANDARLCRQIFIFSLLASLSVCMNNVHNKMSSCWSGGILRSNRG